RRGDAGRRSTGGRPLRPLRPRPDPGRARRPRGAVGAHGRGAADHAPRRHRAGRPHLPTPAGAGRPRAARGRRRRGRGRHRMTATPTGDDVLGHVPDPQGYAWIAPGRAMVGWGVADRICPSGPDRFSVARDWAAPARAPGDVAFGAFTSTPAGTTSALVRPERRLTGPGPHPGPVEPLPAPGRVRYAGGGLAELAWMEAVQAATGRIAAGELEKVVLARDVQ